MKKSNKLTAVVCFRPAQSSDLLINENLLRRGQAFLVRNTDDKTLSGFHVIDGDTNPYELSSWYKSGRLFVPVSCLDQKIQIV